MSKYKMIKKNGVFFLLWLFFFISLYVLYKTPIFWDWLSYVRKIEYTINKWNLDMIDPLWYTDFFVTNPEKPPLLYHPIYFFSLWTTTALTIWNVWLSVDMLNILALIWTMFLIYKLLLLISKNKTLAFLWICFFSFSSMQYWLISHRLIDPVLNFLILFFIYIFLKYKGKKEFLLIIFSVVIFNLKITGVLFLIIIWILYIFCFFIKTKEKVKIIYYLLFWLVLLIPFILFYNKQILSLYPFPSTNIDFQSDIQKSLNNDSNAIKIVKDYWIKDIERLDRLENYLSSGQFWWIIQFFSIFKTNNNDQKNHDFWIVNIWLLFLLSIIFYFKKKENQLEYLYDIILIWFFMLAIILNQLVAIARYSYFINIIFYMAFFIGTRRLFKNNKIFILLYLILLFTQINHNISDNVNYYYSIDHNPTRSVWYSFTDDFNKFEKNPIYTHIIGSSCIFSDSRDFAFRSKIMRKRDSRLFALGKENFLYYYNNVISCEYIVIPYFEKDIITQLKNIFWDPIYFTNTFLIFRYN